LTEGGRSNKLKLEHVDTSFPASEDVGLNEKYSSRGNPPERKKEGKKERKERKLTSAFPDCRFNL